MKNKSKQHVISLRNAHTYTIQMVITNEISIGHSKLIFWVRF